MGVIKKLKSLYADVKGTVGEAVAGNTAKNTKALFAQMLKKRKKKAKKKGKKSPRDIYARGQARKKAMEAVGKY